LLFFAHYWSQRPTRYRIFTLIYFSTYKLFRSAKTAIVSVESNKCGYEKGTKNVRKKNTRRGVFSDIIDFESHDFVVA
jgi:hypothetical protein